MTSDTFSNTRRYRFFALFRMFSFSAVESWVKINYKIISIRSVSAFQTWGKASETNLSYWWISSSLHCQHFRQAQRESCWQSCLNNSCKNQLLWAQHAEACSCLAKLLTPAPKGLSSSLLFSSHAQRHLFLTSLSTRMSSQSFINLPSNFSL